VRWGKELGFTIKRVGVSRGPKKTTPSEGACWELKDGESSRALMNATFNNEDDPGSAASGLVSVSTTPPERSMIALAASAFPWLGNQKPQQGYYYRSFPSKSCYCSLMICVLVPPRASAEACRFPSNTVTPFLHGV
jgi:hypothetical protein